MKTILFDEDFLHQPSELVVIDHEDIEAILLMFRNFFALYPQLQIISAVQLGILKQIIYWNDSRFGLMMNPIILKKIGYQVSWEYCPSCLDNIGLIDRPYAILVQYYNEKKQWVSRLMKGKDTIMFCRAYDHLHGILPIDIDQARFWLPSIARDYFLERHPIKIVRYRGWYEDIKHKERKKRR